MSDRYTEWLNISDGKRPPDHYTLLGIEPFCDDQDTIEQATRGRLTRLDEFTLQYDQEASELMNEVARAHVCLNHPERKRAYDRQLAETLGIPEPASAKTETSPPSQADDELVSFGSNADLPAQEALRSIVWRHLKKWKLNKHELRLLLAEAANLDIDAETAKDIILAVDCRADRQAVWRQRALTIGLPAFAGVVAASLVTFVVVSTVQSSRNEKNLKDNLTTAKKLLDKNDLSGAREKIERAEQIASDDYELSQLKTILEDRLKEEKRGLGICLDAARGEMDAGHYEKALSRLAKVRKIFPSDLEIASLAQNAETRQELVQSLTGAVQLLSRTPRNEPVEPAIQNVERGLDKILPTWTPNDLSEGDRGLITQVRHLIQLAASDPSESTSASRMQQKLAPFIGTKEQEVKREEIAQRETQEQYGKRAEKEQAGSRKPTPTELARAARQPPPANRNRPPVAYQERKHPRGRFLPSQNKPAFPPPPSGNLLQKQREIPEKRDRPPEDDNRTSPKEQAPEAVVSHVCSLPKMFAGGPLETYEMILPGEQRLCAAEGVKKLKLSLPMKPPPGSFRIKGSRILWTIATPRMGDSTSQVDLGGAELRKGEVWWVWNVETLPGCSEDTRRLEKVLRYGVLRGYDAEDKLRLKCQFITTKNIELNLGADHLTKTVPFTWPSDIFRPEICFRERNSPWSLEKAAKTSKNSHRVAWTFVSEHQSQFTMQLRQMSDASRITAVWKQSPKTKRWGNHLETTPDLEDLCKKDAEWFYTTCKNRFFRDMEKTPLDSQEVYERDLTQAKRDCETWLSERKRELGLDAAEKECQSLEMNKKRSRRMYNIYNNSRSKRMYQKKLHSLDVKIKEVSDSINTMKRDKEYLALMKLNSDVQFKRELDTKIGRQSIKKRRIRFSRRPDPARENITDTQLEVEIVAPESLTSLCIVKIHFKPQ